MDISFILLLKGVNRLKNLSFFIQEQEESEQPTVQLSPDDGEQQNFATIPQYADQPNVEHIAKDMMIEFQEEVFAGSEIQDMMAEGEESECLPQEYPEDESPNIISYDI